MNTQAQDPTTPLEGVSVAGIAGESPSRNGIGTYVGLLVLGLGLLATLAGVIAGDPDAAELAAKLGVGAGALTQVGKFAQATAKIATLGRPLAPIAPAAPPVTIVNSTGQATSARPSDAETAAIAAELTGRVAAQRAEPSERALATADVDTQAALAPHDGDSNGDDPPTTEDLAEGPTDLDDHDALAEPVDDEPGAAR